MKEPREYVDRSACIRDLITHQKKKSSHGLLFVKSGKVCANNWCTQARDPSMYLFLHNAVPSLCMVPFPEHERMGKIWTELKY